MRPRLNIRFEIKEFYKDVLDQHQRRDKYCQLIFYLLYEVHQKDQQEQPQLCLDLRKYSN
jgi:hypothetical protein